MQTFDQRFEYLRLRGTLGEETFGWQRYLNQVLYKSQEWKQVRDQVIIRDNGYDLGIDGMNINGKIMVHHINPITIDDIKKRNPIIFDPDNLICVSHQTHMAIHYGSQDLLPSQTVERAPNDTCPWRR